jgi:mannose-6-phosphate isomerase-like protein (cupin superfamily)
MMQGYVLGATDGEHLLQRSGEIVIKVDPTRSSNDLSLGTQLMPLGVGVPRHVHAYWDEVIYVLDGSGFITLNDERLPIQKGATMFVPKGTWHGFENPDTELFACGWPIRRGRRNFSARFLVAQANQPRIFRERKCWPSASRSKPTT